MTAFNPHGSIRKRAQFSGFGIKNFFSGLMLKRNRKKLHILIAVVVGLFVVAPALGMVWITRDLPSPGKLATAGENSTVFLDRNNKVIYEMYKDKNRVPVKLAEIPQYLQKGTVAIEDKSFFQHGGVSFTGIIRAFFSTATGQGVQGGSTLTQQVIKNALLDSRRTPTRKIKEIILAFEVERRYSKNQILEMYLNNAPYGGSYYGVASAARGYFDKEVKDLNLVESAILSGLPQSPTAYSPFSGKDLWRGRAEDVLRRMQEDNYITKEQQTAALAALKTFKFAKGREDITAPHFVFYVRRQVEDLLGEGAIDKGLRIKTTLDLDLQKKSEEIVKKEIEGLKEYKVGNGAAVVLDSEKGEILSYVGSYDYNNEDYGKFDVVGDPTALRQPGSTLKPIVYAALMEKGQTAGSMLMDVKTTFPGGNGSDFIPENYDGKFRGPVQIRYALGNSYNIPAVKALALVGVQDFLKRAYDMGLADLAPSQTNMSRLGLAVSLGGGEVHFLDLIEAYSVFSRGGTRKDISSLIEITDFNGKSLYKAKETKGKKVMDKEIAYLIGNILSDNGARADAFGGSSALVVPGKVVSVKTGTTNDKRDNWAMGFTKGVTVGVWVGNNDNSVMNQAIASGVTGASPIWNKIMREVLKDHPDGLIDRPSKIKEVEIDSLLGGLPKAGQPTRKELFIEGTEPKEVSPFYRRISDKDYIVVQEKDPLGEDGKNKWQEAIDAWAAGQADERYKGPLGGSDKSISDVGDGVAVIISSPQHETSLQNGNITIAGRIYSGGAVSRIVISIDGVEQETYSGDRREFSMPISLDEGIHEVRVEAFNDKDKNGDARVKVGINRLWNDNSISLTPVPPTLTPEATETPEPEE